MAQLRMGLRAYALEEPSPAKVVRRLDRLASQLLESEIVTLVYLVLDLDSGMVRLANAGHPPPLVAGPTARPPTLKQALGHRWDATTPNPSRPASGLSPARPSCSSPTGCEVILGSMVGGVIFDDVALLAFTGVPRVITLEARLEDALAQCDCRLPDDLA